MSAFLNSQVEVTNRLYELGWAHEQLMEIVSAMVFARNDCTEDDPLGAPGWMAWKAGTRRLREIGRRMGLEKNESDQIPSVIDRGRGLKFTVTNTDDGTSLPPPRIPQFNSKKGPGLDRIIRNNQGSLFNFMDAPHKVVPLSTVKKQPGIILCWHICVYNEIDDIRAELSCPVAAENGYFVDFVERIVLIGPGDDPLSRIRRTPPDDSTEYDIPVLRR